MLGSIMLGSAGVWSWNTFESSAARILEKAWWCHVLSHYPTGKVSTSHPSWKMRVILAGCKVHCAASALASFHSVKWKYSRVNILLFRVYRFELLRWRSQSHGGSLLVRGPAQRSRWHPSFCFRERTRSHSKRRKLKVSCQDDRQKPQSAGSQMLNICKRRSMIYIYMLAHPPKTYLLDYTN